MISNPFLSNPKREGLPKKIYTDYSVDKDIVEYAEVDEVTITGDKKTDFVIEKKVVEVNRYNRAAYVDSFRDDVGILNILTKMALSGDPELLNQTKRVSLGGCGDVDATGRPLEEICDVSDYQVDRIDALEKIKATKQNYKDGLTDELADKSYDQLAKMSDADIDAYLANKKAEILAAKAAAEKGDN